MSKNLITGYYGMKNYGDDLFSILTYFSLKKYGLISDCKILAPKQKNNLEVNYSGPQILDSSYPYLNKYGTAIRVINVFYSLAGKIDNIFFSGGSLYSSDNFSTADLMYKKKNCNFHALGVSVGPYKNNNAEKKVINNLKKYSFIGLRDKTSYERVKSYNLDAKIVLASDLAGLGNEFIPKKNKEKNKVKQIGFSPCYVDNNPEKTLEYIESFYSSIKKIKGDFEYSITILCLNENPSNGDVKLCKDIEAKLLSDGIKCKIVYYSALGVIDTWYTISNFDFYFTVRLHGAITAYLTETPFHLYEYHEKCTEFLKLIRKNSDELDLRIALNASNEILLSVEEYSSFSKLNLIEHPFYKGCYNE